MLSKLPQLWCKKVKRRDSVNIFNFAIADADGEIRLYEGEKNESGSIVFGSRGKIAATSVCSKTISTFVAEEKIPGIDLLKDDIEGAEIQLFDSMSDSMLREISQITVEFHDFLPELKLRSEVRRIIERIKKLGFLCIVFSVIAHKDVLFVNTEKHFISKFDGVLFRLSATRVRLENIIRRLRTVWGRVFGRPKRVRIKGERLYYLMLGLLVVERTPLWGNWNYSRFQKVLDIPKNDKIDANLNQFYLYPDWDD
ncbi:MAG: FkbM family methyltransferase [Gammaproteobacteria bacterium]|nr:FkbM family methyltransferase [Gammaproteobacteria bacterium]